MSRRRIENKTSLSINPLWSVNALTYAATRSPIDLHIVENFRHPHAKLETITQHCMLSVRREGVFKNV